MFTLKNVDVITCEEKLWEIDGKTGLFYPTMIKLGDKTFNITSKCDLREYALGGSLAGSVNLECEFQTKTPKTGNGYTGVRIIGVL